jgi:hypothetical protein
VRMDRTAEVGSADDEHRTLPSCTGAAAGASARGIDDAVSVRHVDRAEWRDGRTTGVTIVPEHGGFGCRLSDPPEHRPHLGPRGERR